MRTELGIPVKHRVKRLVPPSAWRLLRLARAGMRVVREAPARPVPLARAEDVLFCLVAYNALGGYCLPRGSLHREAAQAIVRGRVWEEATLALIAERAGAGDIVHAGTYFGDFLPALSRACRPGALVWAFEPGRENVRCAEITIGINGLGNVRLLHAGLGAAEAQGLLTTHDASGRALGGASRVTAAEASGHSAGARAEPVRLVAIDAVVPAERHVGVIHLDVEGHEREALTGAMQTVARCRPLLILETLPGPDWIAARLSPLGYRAIGMTDDNTVFAADRR